MDGFHPREKKLMIVVGIFIVVIVLMGGYFAYVNSKLDEMIIIQKSKTLNSKYVTPSPQKNINNDLSSSIIYKESVLPEDKLILTVGEENIFYKDYEIELLNFSQGKEVSDKMKMETLQKIINDSILIQYSIKKGYVETPDMTLYNSPNKQYAQRLDLIMQCEEKISEKEFKSISGNVLKIAFLNIASEGVTLLDGKEIIRKRINGLYSDIKNGKISIEKAVLDLPKSPEFAKMSKLEIVPTPNEFETIANKKITDLDYYDKLIWETPAKTFTPLFHYSDSGDISTYMFGYVDTKTNSGYTSMKEFYEKNADLYDVKIF